MINHIIDALIKSLTNYFRDEKYPIYTDNVEQGLKKPCFFIFSLNGNQKRKFGNRYEQYYPFLIQYLPQDESEPNIECAEIISVLFECLEQLILSDGSIIQTFEIDCNVVNGVLNCTFGYFIPVRRVKEEVLMMKQKLKGDVNNG